MKSILYSLLIAGTLVVGSPTGFAQAAAAAEPDDLRAVLETLRSDVNAFKVRTLNQALQMTGPEAEKFWPIYRQYEQDLAVVANQKVALLREFGERRAGGTLDHAAANAMAQKWLKNLQARLDLWKKYQKKIAKAVSPARAAEFLQVEHQMALFMDLNIAAEMPALHTVIKPGQP
jgi:RNase H-fold protein (predicted Holliday junction resolvase)